MVNIILNLEGFRHMDPVSHGIIGLALSSYSGVDVSVNPISIGCMLGAMSPDIDFVVRIFSDDKAYLKHHRGLTHSIPFLGLLSLCITAPLYYGFGGEFSFLSILLWTFIGAFSHTFFDMLNSYGAMFFKKKKKASLLMLYDPVIIISSLYMILKGHLNFFDYPIIVGGFCLYLYVRYLMKKKATEKVLDNYQGVVEIEMIPSLINFFSWRYIIKTDTMNISGEYDILFKSFKKVHKFERRDVEIEELFAKSEVGIYFLDFTPNVHIEKIEKEDYFIIKAIDLRYFYRNSFMHHATMHFSHDNNHIESFIHPYKMEKKILFNVG
jgi:inner membrane protein